MDKPSRLHPAAVALLAACLTAGLPGRAAAQNTYTYYSGTSNAWLNATHWAGGPANTASTAPSRRLRRTRRTNRTSKVSRPVFRFISP